MNGVTVPAISLWQPFAALLVNGHRYTNGKRVENRGWPLPQRMCGQWTLVHAALREPTSWDMTHAGEMGSEAGIPVSDIFLWTRAPRGGFVGAVKFGMTLSLAEARLRRDLCPVWADGLFCWETTDARPLPFVPWRGSQGFFRVPLSALPPEYQWLGEEGGA